MKSREIPSDGVSPDGMVNEPSRFCFFTGFTSRAAVWRNAPAKICKVMVYGAQNHAFPCIGINDSGGARIQEASMPYVAMAISFSVIPAPAV
jgi:acetyl-CoA carboxylase carboxyltransferase component